MSTTSIPQPIGAGSTCQSVKEDFRAYLERQLPKSEVRVLEEHLHGCERCTRALAEYQRMFKLMDRTIGSGKLNEAFDRRAEARLKRTPEGVALPSSANSAALSTPLLRGQKRAAREEEFVEEEEMEPVAAAPRGALENLTDRFGAAPWWAVSVVLHVLVIILLGLITMSIGILGNTDSVVVLTNLEKMSAVKQAEEQAKPKSDLRDVLEQKQDTPPTDPNSQVQSNIVVPPDILAKAELGDHFETINLDRPDTQSAFGNPEARMFHSVSGNDEPEGGGGLGGVSLMDDLIGMGGSTSPGSGGGWGGGDGTGTGIGKGAGHGSFGQRNGGGRRLMVMKHGGSKATESAVDKSLEWLARHQEADGSWNAWKYEALQDARTQGVNGDAACTGFAILAFLGAGHTEKVGKYKDHVRRGVFWLMKALDEHEKAAGPGRWCKNHGSNYTQGVAALALAEASAMGRNPEVKISAQKAINGVVAGQIKIDNSEYHAWDYAPGGTTNDTSVTGWSIMALKSAKIAGLQVEPAAFEGAMKWINSGQDLKGAPKDGDAEYWEGGMMTYRGRVGDPPQPKNMAMTAAAALTRLFVGGEKPSHPGVAGPCNLMKKPANLPTADKAHFNLYYWYYATLTMFQKGGDHWKEWNEPMKRVLPETQRKDGDFDGSWDPLFGEPQGHIYGGRVMSTALGALCLEVYYRYLPIYKN